MTEKESGKEAGFGGGGGGGSGRGTGFIKHSLMIEFIDFSHSSYS